MKILVTGNLGYIGPVLIKFLKNKYKKKISITGIDIGYFENFITDENFLEKQYLNEQIYCDLREINQLTLSNYDSIILLAAISNDPIGNNFKKTTYETNVKANIQLIKSAITSGVKNIVFASSCSIYGDSGFNSKKKITEFGSLNPLTPYAKSKVAIERLVKKMNLKKTIFTSLRFATACGVSKRIRLDLALNEMVWSAAIKNKIILQSDGSQYRPLIDVNDMSRAIDWAVHRKIINGGQYLELNVGNKNSNIKIINIVNKIKKILPRIKIIKPKNAIIDKRSYRVDFRKFYKLAKNHRPKKNLKRIIKELIIYYNSNKKFKDDNFVFFLKRLNVLREKIKCKIINKSLKYF
jgi:nucleoside-diphosphate-sugar epimerase